MESHTFHFVGLCLLLTLSYGHADSASDAFQDVGTRFFEWRMQDRPLQSTKKGMYKYNDILEQFTLDKIDERKAKAERLLTDVQNITEADLSAKEVVEYKILKDMLETFLAGYDWRSYTLNSVNFLSGIHQNPRSFVEWTPLDTVGDYRNYITRLKLLPKMLLQFEELMTEAMRRDATLHTVTMTRVLDQITTLTSQGPQKSVFYAPFDKLDKTHIPQEEWRGIKQAGYDAVRKLLAAYRSLFNWIKRDYLPRTRRNYGVNKDYYKACLKWYTSTDMTPEDIHQLGLEEVARIEGRMYEILEKQNFSGTIKDYFGELSKNRTFFKTSAKEVLDEFTSIISDRIDPFLPRMFKEEDIPKYDLRVIPMLNDGPAGRYRRPSPDGRIPGTFLANVFRPAQMPVYTFMSLAMHEGNPGHHLQISAAMSADSPQFMKNMEYPHTYQVPYAFPSYSAIIEGWALYAESLGEEFDLYESDFELMGRFSSEIFRAARLVVDTGIHYFDWDREQATQYIMNYTSKTRPFVEVEVDRYITWPGQAVSYKIGELRIKDLRQIAEDYLEKYFDLREFHSAVLAGGFKPLDLMEQSVRAWMVRYREEKEMENSASDVTHVSVTSLVTLTVLSLLGAHRSLT